MVFNLFCHLAVIGQALRLGSSIRYDGKAAAKVINDLDSAASDRKKAETLANEREAALKNSRQEATQILSDAKTNAQNTGKEIVASANEDAAAIRKKANEEAAKAKSDALNAARDQVADISVAIAEKLLLRIYLLKTKRFSRPIY